MKPKYDGPILINVIRGYTGNFNENNLRNTMWPDTFLGGRLTIKAEMGKHTKVNITINI